MNLMAEPQQHRRAAAAAAPPSTATVVSSAALLILAVYAAASVWGARDDPHNLLFALGSYAQLGLLFWCIRCFERLPNDGDGVDAADVGKRRARLKLAVWTLATALSVTLCYRISGILPFGLAAIAWALALLVAAGGFYILFF